MEDVIYMGAIFNALGAVKVLQQAINDGGKSLTYTRENLKENENQVKLDQELIHAIQGACFGAFLTLRNKGFGEQARGLFK